MLKTLKRFTPLLVIVITLTISLLFFQKTQAVSINLNIPTGLGTASVTEIISRIIQIFLGLLGVIALGFILYGGFIWMTAAGNQEKIAKAKKILINAAIGLAIILSAFAIVTFLINAIIEGTGGGPSGPPACNDTIDNDGDNLIDYPADPGCVDIYDNDEWNPTNPPPQTNFYVATTYPPMNAEDISVCVSLQATFNRLIDSATVSPGGNDNFTLKECTNGSITNCTPSATAIDGLATSTGQFLTFNPTDDLPINSAFEARVKGGTGGIRSIEGYTLTGNAPGGLVDYVWYFATGEEDDNTPPQVVIVYPNDGETNVCLNTTIQVEFNEPMLVSSIANPNSMDLYHHDLQGSGSESLYSGSFSYTNNSEYTIFNYIPQQLLDNENYRPLLQSDTIMDVCENHLDGDGDGSYKEGGVDDYAPPLVGTPPDWSFDTGTTPECTPLITNITPDNGYYDGNFITINGSNFINNFPGNGDVVFSSNLPVYDDLYCFNASQSFPQIPETMCLVNYGEWTATQIKMKIPAKAGDSNGAIAGALRVEVPSQSGNLVSNSVNFDVRSPHITSLSPASGGEGQFVTIYGTNFGTTESEVRFFNQTNNVVAVLPCEDTGWNPTYIIIAVPDNLALGQWNIQVKTSDNHWSNIETFEVTSDLAGPGLCELDPNSGVFETQFNLDGVNFGATQGSSQVLFGTDIEAPVVPGPGHWSNESIDALVPNIAPGVAPVSVKVNNVFSNSLPFTVESTPTTGFYITYISPTSGPENQYVTVYGNGFGPTKGPNDTVLFNSTSGNFNFPVECSTNYWSNTQIIVKVPGGLPTGPDNVQVRVKKGTEQTNAVDFTFEDTGTPTPGICSINPASGPTTQEVELAGESFATVNQVDFSQGNYPVLNPPFTYQSPNTIIFNVPDNANVGGSTVKVKNQANQYSNPVNFEVLSGAIGGGPFDYYEWQFETCDNCLIPEVVSILCANNLASPNPNPGTIDNFTNIDFAVKFNTLMADATFDWGMTVKLQNCGTGGDPLINCSNVNVSPEPTFTFTPDLLPDPDQEWLEIDLPDAFTLDNNTWYRVLLTGAIESDEGWSLYNGSGYSGWLFKTQETGQECVANTVNVVPNPSTAIVAQTIDYTSQAVNSYTCNICDDDEFSWDWYPSGSYLASVQILTENENQSTVQAINVTYPNAVQITAAATPFEPPGQPAVTGYSDLFISAGQSCDADLLTPACQPDPSACDPGYECNAQTCLCQPLPYPVVIDYGPNCGNACGNTLIYATFNLPMKTNTLTYDNIDIFPCADQNCNPLFGKEINFTISFDPNYQDGVGGFRVNLTPNNPSILNTGWYRVILKDEIEAQNGENLGNLNYNYQGASNNSFSWKFEVTTSYCNLESVEVSPASHTFTAFSQAYPYMAYAYADGNCGAPLNPSGIDSWTWDLSGKPIVTVAQSTPAWTATVTSDNTEDGPSYVKITAVDQGNSVTNQNPNGEVWVNLTGPQVLQGCYDGYLSPAPTIGGNPQNVDENVCINAAVSARFNTAMNPYTINNGQNGVVVWGCNTSGTYNPDNCHLILNGRFEMLETEGVGIDGFIWSPPTNFNTDTWYKVIIPTAVKSSNNIPLDQQYEWHFKTRESSNLCEPQIVAVSPAGPVVIPLDTSQDYIATPMTGECEYIIADNDRIWNWTSTNNQVATVNPEINNQPIGETTATGNNLGETDIQASTSGITGSSHLIVSDYPNVESTVPADGATNICRNTEISATFNQLMNTQTIGNNFKVENKILIPDLQAQQWSCTYYSQGPAIPEECEIGGGSTYNNLFQRPIAVIKNYSNKVLEKIFLALSNLKNNFFEKATADNPPLPDYPPPPVTGFTADAITSIQINLSWNDVITESGYKIWRSTTQNVFPATPLVILPDNTTAYSDTTADPCTDYYYRIVAYNTFGESPFVDTAESTPNASNNYYWCGVNGTFNFENNNNQTTAYFNPLYLLPANAEVRVKILGGENGVKNNYNLAMINDHQWEFDTGQNICEINFVKVYSNYISESNNSTSWLFTTNVDDENDNNPADPETYDTLNDADKVYTAKAYSISGQPLTETSEYNWEWSWESDNTIVANVTDTDNFQQLVTAGGQNGIAYIMATASTTPASSPLYQAAKKTGTATAEVDICENPWIDPLTTQTPEPGGNYTYPNGYFQDNAYNFKLKYCRDAGAQGTGDDLPILDQTPLFSTPNVTLPSGDEFKKEYIFWISDYPPPTDLEATLGARVGNQQTVGLNWTEVTAPNLDLEYYEFQRATTGTFQNFTTFTCNSSPCNNTFTLSGSTYLTTVYYYFRVKAVYLTGPTATSSSAWSNIDNVGVNIGPGTGT